MNVSEPLTIVEVQRRVGILRLNRPAKLNALNSELAEALSLRIAEFESDEAIDVYVIGGSTDRAFSAGADITEQVDRINDHKHREGSAFQHLLETLSAARKPVVAIIEGYCFGGGLHLAMKCDLRVCSTTARFKHTGVDLGVAMGAQLASLVGPVAAKEIVMTADVVDAEEALRVGLVNRVAAAGEAWGVGLALAHRIAANDAHALRSVKRIIDLAAATPDASALERLLHNEFKASRRYASTFRAGVAGRVRDI
jgi:enoyl-CoA hydratase